MHEGSCFVLVRTEKVDFVGTNSFFYKTGNLCPVAKATRKKVHFPPLFLPEYAFIVSHNMNLNFLS